MTYYHIGTSESGGVTGSRPAKSGELSEALEETRVYSEARHVRMAWLREVERGQMGDVIAVFEKGERLST